MTVHQLPMHITMFVSSFIAGIALYYLISMEHLQAFLQLVEPVVLTESETQQLYIIIRTALTFLVITIFASHPLLSIVSYFVIAMKIVLFSLCSMYIVIEHQNVLAYCFWWFPIQLVQCIVLIIYYTRMKLLKGKSVQVIATIILFILIEIVILLAELVIIRYV